MPKVGGLNSFLNKIEGVVVKEEFPNLIVVEGDYLSSLLMRVKNGQGVYLGFKLHLAFIWASLSETFHNACRDEDMEEVRKGLLDILHMLEGGAKFKFQNKEGYYTIKSFNDYCDAFEAIPT